MAEHEGVGGGESESGVRVSVDGGDETLIENMGFQGQDEEGGSGACNGEDIMVEVLGSDVFVDGVCTKDGVGSEGNLDEGAEEGGGEGTGEAGLGREVKFFDGGSGGNDDLASKGVGVLGEKGANSGEGGVEGSSVIEKLSCEQTQVEGGETRVVVEEGADRGREVVDGEGEGNGDLTSREVGVLDDKARKFGLESAGGGSSAVEEAGKMVSEEGLARKSIQEGVEKVVDTNDGGGVVCDDSVTQRVGVLEDEAGNPGIETPVVCSSSMVESLDAQTQVAAEEVADVVKEEGLITKDEVPVGESLDEETQVAGSLCSQEDQPLKVEVAGGSTGNHSGAPGPTDLDQSTFCSVKMQHLKVESVSGITGRDGAACADSKSSVEKTQDAGGDSAVIDDKVLIPDAGVPKTDAVDKTENYSESNQNLMVETTCGSSNKDGIVLADLKSSDEQTPLVDKVEASEMKTRLLNSKVEVPRTDALDENLSHSGSDQESKVVMVSGSSENGVTVCAHTEASGKQVQVVVGSGVAAMHNKEVSDSKVNVPDTDCSGGTSVCLENEQNRKDKSICEGIVRVGNLLADSEISEKQTQVADDVKEVLNEVEVSQSDALDGTLCSTVAFQESKGEIAGGGTEKYVACADVKSSGEQAQIAVYDVAIVDKKEVSIPNSEVPKQDAIDGETAGMGIETVLEVPKTNALDENLSFSENQDAKVEMESENKEKDEGLNGNVAPLYEGLQAVDGGEAATVDGEENLKSKAEAVDKLEKPETVLQPAETVPAEADGDWTMSPSTVEEISKQGICVTVDSQGEVCDEIVCAPVSPHHEGGEVQRMEEKVVRHVSECNDESAACEFMQVGSNEGQEMEDEGRTADAEQTDLHEGHEIDAEEQLSDTELTTEEEKIFKQSVPNPKPGSSVRMHQATYQLQTENEGEFSLSDLVWGKVRSHPWWPGQIFDPSDSSEKAMKYHKKDCFLVAYFGDRTFAWNDASLLKPFRTHFALIEKQSNAEAFHNAVNCALEEVSRRVELGLSCSCIQKDTYDNIRFQTVENTGIRQESSRRDGVDKSASADSFEPDKFLEYIKALARFPSGGADRLELVIAKAQSLAFHRRKGYDHLPEFQFCGGLLENNADISFSEDVKHSSEVIDFRTLACKDGEQLSSGHGKLKSPNSSSHKRKHNLKDSMYPRKKERSLSELMGGTVYSPDDENGSDGRTTSKLGSSSSGKKRKSVDSFDDDSVVQDRRRSIFTANVTHTTSPVPRQSFKIGECIRRVASQLTGSPSILKCSSIDKTAGASFDVSFQAPDDSHGGKMTSPAECSSLDDMLSQLQLAARDPMKGYSFSNTIVSFFSDFRNSIIPVQYSRNMSGSGRKKKSSRSFLGLPETFEFEDMNDTYWTDRVIQNGSEEQPTDQNKKGEYQLVTVEPEDSLQVSPRLYKRRKSSGGRYRSAPQQPVNVEERKQDPSPTELIMSFSDMDSVPSETNLNKIFRRFGPLKESETEVDRVTNRARVIFKRCSDAEVAYSSAGKFNIFGPMLVNYQLSYTPTVPFKISPIEIPIETMLELEDAT